MSQATTWTKKLRKFFSKIFTFHRRDPYDFPQIISKMLRRFFVIFLEKSKGPPYEK